MREIVLIGIISCLALCGHAFRDTGSLLAWASSPVDCGTPLFVHVPGLGADLAQLEERSAIRRAWSDAEGGRLHLPHIQPSEKHPIDLVMSSVACHLRQDFSTESIDVFASDLVDRTAALQRLDETVEQRLRDIEGEHLVIITSHKPEASRIQKRQLDGSSVPERGSLTILQGSSSPSGDSSGNSTLPGPNAPALAKYSIITPIQIMGLLIFLLILLPSVTWTTGLLTQIATPQGLLNNKMGGPDPKKKDQ